MCSLEMPPLLSFPSEQPVLQSFQSMMVLSFSGVMVPFEKLMENMNSLPSKRHMYVLRLKNDHSRDARNSFYLGELCASILFQIHKEDAHILL